LLMLMCGADPTIKNNFGQSPLDLSPVLDSYLKFVQNPDRKASYLKSIIAVDTLQKLFPFQTCVNWKKVLDKRF